MTMTDTYEEASYLAQHAGAVVLRGIIAVLFGLAAIFAPALSLAALVFVFGVYVFVDGVLALFSALRHGERGQPWWAVALEGILGIGAGVVTFFRPGITAIALVYMIAAWSMVTGVLEIAAAIRLRRAIRGEWLLALSGIASLALGVMLGLFPLAGSVALVLWLGLYACAFGGLLIALGLRLRTWHRKYRNTAGFDPLGPRPARGGSHG